MRETTLIIRARVVFQVSLTAATPSRTIPPLLGARTAREPPRSACVCHPGRGPSGGRHGLAEVFGPNLGILHRRRTERGRVPLPALDQPGNDPRTARGAA